MNAHILLKIWILFEDEIPACIRFMCLHRHNINAKICIHVASMASSFLQFWALYRFKTCRHLFTQICPGIVLLFWVQGHAHITCVQDPISVTKLIQTQTNQRIIWDRENRTEENQIDQTDYALSCSLCRSKTVRFDPETISMWFSSQRWCKSRQPECGKFRYLMHCHSTEHLLKVAHVIAVFPQWGPSLFPAPGQVSCSRQ